MSDGKIGEEESDKVGRADGENGRRTPTNNGIIGHQENRMKRRGSFHLRVA